MLRHIIVSGEHQLMGDSWISKEPMKMAINIGPRIAGSWPFPDIGDARN